LPRHESTIQHLEACGVDLYLDQQNIDMTTPAGKLMFQITGAFAEFERSMIRTRVNAGLKRAKDQIRKKGHFVTKHGEVKKRLGRPGADPEKLRKARAELTKGIGINKVAKMVGLGVGTVQRVKREMVQVKERGGVNLHTVRGAL
jgi:DNA invertase Pin-like site-specific DNA recombinase